MQNFSALQTEFPFPRALFFKRLCNDLHKRFLKDNNAVYLSIYLEMSKCDELLQNRYDGTGSDYSSIHLVRN